MDKNKTISTAIEMLAFAKVDAMSNLEAKRGCSWANELIVALAKAVEKLVACENFYLKGRKTPVSDLLANFLEEKDGLIRTLEHAEEKCLHARPLPNGDEIETLNFATALLCQKLGQIPGFENEQFVVNDFSYAYEQIQAAALLEDNETNRREMAAALRDYLFNIAETAYRLRLHEYKVWHDHQKWIPDVGEWVPSGPFNGRESYNNLYAALKAFDAKYGACFSWLNNGIGALLSPYRDLPVAFLRHDRPYTYAHVAWRSVRALLVQPVTVSFRHPPELAACLGIESEDFSPSRFLAERRHEFLKGMKGYLTTRAFEAPRGSDVRRMWLEAAAEFLSNISLHQPVFSDEQADRVLTLAHRAQRESWIVERLNQKRTSEMVELLGPEPEAPVGNLGPGDAEERLVNALKYIGDMQNRKGKKKRKTVSSTALRPGKYAAKFVTLCDPKKGLLVLNGNITFNLPPTSKQVWKAVKMLVLSKDPDGWTKLPPKWKSSFHRRDKLGKRATDSSHEQLLKLIRPQDLHPGCKGTKHRLIPPSGGMQG